MMDKVFGVLLNLWSDICDQSPFFQSLYFLMLRFVTVVQARMSSTRLPGKVMLQLGKLPLLLTMVKRLQRSKLAGTIVVATTIEEADNPIAELCTKSNVQVYRGHSTDLLDRHYQCARAYGADVVLKIPSDCPLIDSTVVDRVVAVFKMGNFDYVSNLHPPTYPDGQDVEVISMDALYQAWSGAKLDFEREHTTPFIWERPEKFRIGNVIWDTGMDYSNTHRITIDYPEDYLAIKAIYDHLILHKPEFGINDIAALIDARPDIKTLNNQHLGVNWYRHHLSELKTINPNQSRG